MTWKKNDLAKDDVGQRDRQNNERIVVNVERVTPASNRKASAHGQVDNRG
jgi:hypothetical protein